MPLRACDLYIYRYGYEARYAERVPTHGGMDSELSGKYITEQRDYFVIAPSEELALVMFKKWHRDDKHLDFELIGQCSDLVFTQ